MGVCVSACIKCATYTHDKYTNWRWDRDDDFLSYQPVNLNTGNYHKCRTLYSAVIDKNVSEIKRILAEEGETKDTQDNCGETAVHMACKLGYVVIVDALLEGGCSPGLQTSIGTPLHCVVKALHSGYITQIEGDYLMDKLACGGCNIDAVDKGQKTAIFHAAEVGQIGAIDTLLNLGADVNLTDSNCFSPLYMACIRGDLRAVNLLLRKAKHLNLNGTDSTGRTSLVAALLSIRNDFIGSLGISNWSNGLPSSTSILQSKYNRFAVAETLLHAGADPNVVDNLGRSSLMVAFKILELDELRLTVSGDSLRSEEETIRMYAPLVRLLIIYGAEFPPEWQDYSSVPVGIRDVYEESRLAIKTHVITERPRRLLHLCRMTLRGHLAFVQKLQDINKLPLPDKLKDYVNVVYV